MLRLPRNLHFEVHQVLRLHLHLEVHKVLCLPRNLHFELHKVLCLSRKCYTCHENCNEPEVEKQRFTVPVTKSELVEDHHHVQSAAPATKSAVRSQAAPIPLRLSRKVDFESRKHEVSLAPATKKSPPCAKMRTEPQRERSR